MNKLLVVAGLALVVTGASASQRAPDRLSETGLYAEGTLSVDPGNRAYSPQYPLWSDGATKSRWVQLPAGTRIDARDPNTWQFPVGTKFWKEFSFNGRRVETRFLWHSSTDGWTYATYVWNAEQTDATLAPEAGVRRVAEIGRGRAHSIPSVEDCHACHDNGPTPVIGFNALQLSTDRDPGALHAERLAPDMLTLRTLLDDDQLTPARHDWIAHPPRIPGDPKTRAVLGYLTANCGMCHNETSSLATVRYPLRARADMSIHDVEAVVGQLQRAMTSWEVPHTEPGTSRFVSAGQPALSAMLARMRSRQPSSQMPPLGTVTPDDEALRLIDAWIAGLQGP